MVAKTLRAVGVTFGLAVGFMVGLAVVQCSATRYMAHGHGTDNRTSLHGSMSTVHRHGISTSTAMALLP